MKSGRSKPPDEPSRDPLNLHCLDLTKEQRDEHIRRYAELLEARREQNKPGQVVQVSGGRGNKSVATEIAEETGLSARTVRRALNPPEPKAPLPDYDVVTVQFNSLMSAWNRAGSEARIGSGSLTGLVLPPDPIGGIKDYNLSICNSLYNSP